VHIEGLPGFNPLQLKRVPIKMITDLSIPRSATPYILFQRTAYITFPKRLAFRIARKLLPFLNYERSVSLEAKLRNASICREYLEDIAQEYASIKDYLPKECERLMDIGCGVAGIDLFLDRHYGDRHPHIYLLDKSHIEEKVFYLYKDKGAFYNSLEVAREVLTSNGIDSDHVHLVEATDNNDINTDDRMDLIISLISWGFHYPVETYLDRAYETLKPGGALILDVRKDTGGIEAIEDKFGDYRVVLDGEKHLRVCATRPAT
jgi:SAM-dependent methyltransferase